MKTLLIAVALGTTATAALAQTGSPPQPAPSPYGGGMHGGRGLMRADANHDGIVTRDEMIADATRRFDRLDANHDGKLDASELPRRPTAEGTPPPPAGE